MYRRPITAESGNQLLTIDCTSTVFDDTVVYSLVNTRYLLDHLRLQLVRYLPDHLRLQIVDRSPNGGVGRAVGRAADAAPPYQHSYGRSCLHLKARCY